LAIQFFKLTDLDF